MSAPVPELIEVNRWLDELESSVEIAEFSLRTRKWRELGEAIAQQRRSTHGLRNALEQRTDLPPEKRMKVDQRIQAILARRATQIKRLQRFEAQVGERLRQLTKFKYAVREMASPKEPIILNTER